jgi:hypothetical protein
MIRLLVFWIAVRIVLVVRVLKCVRGKRDRMREKGEDRALSLQEEEGG